MWKAYYRKFCHCAILQNGKSGYVFVENGSKIDIVIYISVSYNLSTNGQKSAPDERFCKILRPALTILEIFWSFGGCQRA
jgi:hypothetical protein